MYGVIRRYVSSYSTPEQTVYDIRVLVFNDIHAVPIVRKSFLLEDDPHRSDSIGHDLIRVVTAHSPATISTSVSNTSATRTDSRT